MIDVSRLLTTLQNTKLQNENQPLFQVLTQLIKGLLDTNRTIINISSGSNVTIKPKDFEAYISLKVL